MDRLERRELPGIRSFQDLDAAALGIVFHRAVTDRDLTATVGRGREWFDDRLVGSTCRGVDVEVGQGRCSVDADIEDTGACSTATSAGGTPVDLGEVQADGVRRIRR